MDALIQRRCIGLVYVTATLHANSCVHQEVVKVNISLENSTAQSSLVCAAANCKFQRTSSTEGLSDGMLDRHLTHISIIVFNDSPEHSFCTVGSAILLRDESSVVMLACTCGSSRSK